MGNFALSALFSQSTSEVLPFSYGSDIAQLRWNNCLQGVDLDTLNAEFQFECRSNSLDHDFPLGTLLGGLRVRSSYDMMS